MNKSLSIFFLLILVAVFTVSVLAAGTPHVPKGSGIPSHGLHSDGGVQPESFNYMDLPHSSTPYTGPMIERPEPVDPEETLGALPDISEVKNFSNGILSQAPIYQPPLPTVPSLVTGFLGPNYGGAIPTEPTAVAGPAWCARSRQLRCHDGT